MCAHEGRYVAVEVDVACVVVPVSPELDLEIGAWTPS
jgi:hypothetical protein